MHFPLRIGETTTIIDPETGEPVTVTFTGIENGKAVIQVVGSSEFGVTKVQDESPESPPHRLHCDWLNGVGTGRVADAQQLRCGLIAGIHDKQDA